MATRVGDAEKVREGGEWWLLSRKKKMKRESAKEGED